jgi:hypothetical protein
MDKDYEQLQPSMRISHRYYLILEWKPYAKYCLWVSNDERPYDKEFWGYVRGSVREKIRKT